MQYQVRSVPLGIEGDRSAVNRGEPGDRFICRILVTGAVGAGVPTGKNIAAAGKHGVIKFKVFGIRQILFRGKAVNRFIHAGLFVVEGGCTEVAVKHKVVLMLAPFRIIGPCGDNLVIVGIIIFICCKLVF